MCVGKMRFASAEQATQVARKMRQQSKRVRPYRCRVCTGWHVGETNRDLTGIDVDAAGDRRARIEAVRLCEKAELP